MSGPKYGRGPSALPRRGRLHRRRAEVERPGIRAVKISLVGLGLTAVLQLAVVLVSGSVALLADTIHNFSDALTAVPLWIAFVSAVAPRPGATPTATAGPRPGRSVRRGDDRPVGRHGRAGRRSPAHPPRPVDNLGWVAARRVGWLPGNEAGRPLPDPRGAPSARPPSSPTVTTPVPTGSPLWPSSSAPAASPLAGPGPTRSSACYHRRDPRRAAHRGA